MGFLRMNLILGTVTQTRGKSTVSLVIYIFLSNFLVTLPEIFTGAHAFYAPAKIPRISEREFTSVPPTLTILSVRKIGSVIDQIRYISFRKILIKSAT